MVVQHNVKVVQVKGIKMQVLFRAEVKNIGKLANCQVEPLTKINEKYYAIGFESDLDGEYGITDLDGYYIECKRETRSINISDMIDSEGTKIFASLSEDGRGGDRFSDDGVDYIVRWDENLSIVAMIKKSMTNPDTLFEWSDIKNNKWVYNLKVTGIQE